MILRATLSRLPPSVNRMYIHTGRGPILSAEARKFKSWATLELTRAWSFEPKLDKTKPYELTLLFYLPKLYNATWPKKAKNRFAKKDVTNLIKVLEDVISHATSIDDSCTVAVHVYKKEDAENPRVEITLEELADES